MSPGIHCCHEDDDLSDAIHHMEELSIRRLPVIGKDKRMVGILSLGDRGLHGDWRSSVEIRQRHFGAPLKWWLWYAAALGLSNAGGLKPPKMASRVQEVAPGYG
jgi:CBS-domain-containing membrane protein